MPGTCEERGTASSAWTPGPGRRWESTMTTMSAAIGPQTRWSGHEPRRCRGAPREGGYLAGQRGQRTRAELVPARGVGRTDWSGYEARLDAGRPALQPLLPGRRPG